MKRFSLLFISSSFSTSKVKPMKRQLLSIALGVTTLTSVVTLTNTIFPAFSQANSSNSQSDKVTFLCKEIFDPASGEKIPATVAWVPERRGHVRLIAWKSEIFPNFTPQKRCQVVTPKFQEFYDQGLLNYLTYGTNKGYPVICSIPNQGESCNDKNQLFTIKPGSKPEIVFEQLMGTLTGQSRGPLYQSSGQQVYVNVKEFLNKARLEKIQ
jgi:hypothetical protein